MLGAVTHVPPVCSVGDVGALTLRSDVHDVNDDFA
jgi:hypothetical protein